MRYLIALIALFFLPCCFAQEAVVLASKVDPELASKVEPIRKQFHVLYVNGANIYIDGGRNDGLGEGTKLVLKQDPTKPVKDGENVPVEPGVIAKLTVVSIASSSAVCEIAASSRNIAVGDTVSMPDDEVEKIVEANTLGNTRKYPMIVAFSQGDPLDEEVRNTIPRPPLPEINQARGRIGFDLSTIRELGKGSSTSTEFGMVIRADITRIYGTHWNLTGDWRGYITRGTTPSQPTMQDLMNLTYLLSASYVNPQSRWTAGVGRLFLPWAASLETIDGGYFGRQFPSKFVIGVFGGSTPDPTSWSYNPQGKIFGAFVNKHGGSFEGFRYSSTAGGGVNLISWTVNRPFVFTENNFSFKHLFMLYHSMQIDRPTANPSTPAIGVGLGQSLLTVRVQVHPRVTVDLTDTYFRDVPTYVPSLLGTGLLDKYLFQGLNGGARIQFPMHIAGYFTVGQSSDSGDPKISLNTLYGVTMSNIWKTGLRADLRYSKFNSSFASGSYKTVSITRDLTQRFQLNAQAGNYSYTSPFASSSDSIFVNLMFDMNVGAKYFLESAFTTQRGGTQPYDQFTIVFGYRFNNRSSTGRLANVDKK